MTAKTTSWSGVVSQRTTAATVESRFWAQSMPVQYHAPAGSGQDRSAGGPRLAAPDVFELPRRDVRAARGVEHPLHRGRVDGATSISPAVGVEGIGLQIVQRVNQRGRRQA